MPNRTQPHHDKLHYDDDEKSSRERRRHSTRLVEKLKFQMCVGCDQMQAALESAKVQQSWVVKKNTEKKVRVIESTQLWVHTIYDPEPANSKHPVIISQLRRDANVNFNHSRLDRERWWCLVFVLDFSLGSLVGCNRATLFTIWWWDVITRGRLNGSK